MKRPTRIYTGLFILLVAAIAHSGWETLGPEGGPVKFVLQSQSDGETFYAFAGGSQNLDVLVSLDGGSTWNPTGSVTGTFNAVAVDPSERLFGGRSGYVYTSDDSGQTWVPHSTPDFTPMSFAVHPVNQDVIYSVGTRLAGGSNRMSLAKSTDNGSTWSVLTISTSFVGMGLSIAVCDSDPDVIYAGGSTFDGTGGGMYGDPKFFRSDDGGSSFTEIVNPDWNPYFGIYSVAVHPADPDIVTCGTSSVFYRSTDGGGTWSVTATGKYYGYGMIHSAANPDYVYAGGRQAFYRSIDGGATWTSHTSGLDGGTYMSLAADRGNESRVFTVSYSGVFLSEDAAATWSAANTGLCTAEVLSLCSVSSSGFTLYASMVDLGLYVTENQGASWDMLGTPLSCGDICALGTPPDDPDRIFALEGAG